eukprot:gene6891-30867_t
MGGASTWSLERLDALAAECRLQFRIQSQMDAREVSHDGVENAMKLHPVEAIEALNVVLFEKHGYRACNRYGNPRDSHFSSVLETGVGCSASLSLLYLEICKRLGIPMSAQALEDGNHTALCDESGLPLVVDPYGCGDLLPLSEDIQAASKRELVAALLGVLRDAHWAHAVGCSASPMSLMPLTIDTALKNRVGSINFHSARSAASAAYKRVILLPEQR